jgi:hypothetical protein
MNIDSAPASRTLVTALSLGLLAALTVIPLLLEPSRNALLEPYASTATTFFVAISVLLLMGLALAIRAGLDRATETHAGLKIVLFAVLAGAMTLVHWFEVDRDPWMSDWQHRIYLQQFNGQPEAPHNYRPLPHGFVCLVERLTRNWDFACLSYRWFFTFWFVWASYRLARRYLNPHRALLTLTPLVLLYPLSVLCYAGQLTDPLSHSLFVLAFLYLLEDRPFALMAALALGVAAKETVVLVAPAYLACYWRRGWRTWWITAALGGACVAAYLAARLPLGWSLSYGNINGAGLMIGRNLGFGPRPAEDRPVWENYLHVLLFVGIFLPVIVWRWRVLDARLRVLMLVVVPLLLLSNVCFGWLYESRNYMPLVPLLATACGAALNRQRQVVPQSDLKERQVVGT